MSVQQLMKAMHSPDASSKPKAKKTRLKHSCYLLTFNTNKTLSQNAEENEKLFSTLKKATATVLAEILKPNSPIIEFSEGSVTDLVKIDYTIGAVEIGPKNGLVHCHQYLDVNHRAKVRLNYGLIRKLFNKTLGFDGHFDASIHKGSKQAAVDYVNKAIENVESSTLPGHVGRNPSGGDAEHYESPPTPVVSVPSPTAPTTPIQIPTKAPEPPAPAAPERKIRKKRIKKRKIRKPKKVIKEPAAHWKPKIGDLPLLKEHAKRIEAYEGESVPRWSPKVTKPASKKWTPKWTPRY